LKRRFAARIPKVQNSIRISFSKQKEFTKYKFKTTKLG